MSRPIVLALALLLALPGLASAQAGEGSSAHVRALAVAQQPDGTLVGSTSDMTVRVLPNGSGNVYVSTIPLAQIDMQGSARLAVKVASATTGLATNATDFLFLIRSDSTLIGGPSAGGILTVATIAAMESWTIRDDTLMTGTINPDGTIGPVGGVPEKAQAAAQAGAKVFLYPAGQEATDGDIPGYCAANLKIVCKPVTTIEDAVAALTGHAFAPRVATGAPDAGRFNDLMRVGTNDSLATASAQLDAARAALAGAQAALSATLARSLQSSLDDSQQLLANASEEAKAGAYYTLSTRAFQASIETRYVLDTVQVASASDRSAALQVVVGNVTAAIATAQKASAAVAPLTAANVQLAAAAQSRLADAQRTRDAARSAAENATSSNALLNALHDLAYAQERAHTVVWWANLAAQLPNAGNATVLSAAQLEGAAQDAIAEADDMTTYANLLVSESQADATQLQVAQASLDHARSELADGLAAAAAFDATEAGVRAGLAIELIGVQGTPAMQTRTDLAKSAAQAAIDEARAAGKEPVMAQSYFELGSTSSAGVDQLAWFQLARTVARFDPTTSAPAQPRTAALAAPERAQLPATPVDSAPYLGAVLVGLVGLGVGVALARRPRALPPPARDLGPAPAEPAAPAHPTFLETRTEPPGP